MDNRLTDLSHPAVAAQSRNKTAIAGTCTMNTVLAAAQFQDILLFCTRMKWKRDR